MTATIEIWPHQATGICQTIEAIEAGARRICLTSPTGGGKTKMIQALIEWGLEQKKHVVLYTNRRLLIDQLARVLSGEGIEFGIRAANHQDQRERQVQISSLPTENQRVLKTERWQVHGHGEDVLALVDEAHLNKSNTAEKILGKHYAQGGAYVGFTATPIDLAHLYESLIIAGTPSELRACGALVPAHHFGPDEPDMKGFKQNIKTGEYSENDVRKAIMTKAIFGRVLDHWKRYNPTRRPTLLFAPGVQESIWFAQQFETEGLRAASIDGDGVWLDGEYHRDADRQRVLSDVRSGRIQILCNRFVLREGLDLPEVSHLILATVMGSLQTYLQSCGRGLRACAGKEVCTIQDHGGHWWRHGSVNQDRRWELGLTENIIKGTREDGFREKRFEEPIVCPKCGKVRSHGPVCPACLHESTKRSRMVIQQSGTLKEHVGDIFRPRRTAMYKNTQQLWEQMYYRSKNKKRTFRAAEALFFVENHYWPPRDLPLMPTRAVDWFKRVDQVPRERLL